MSGLKRDKAALGRDPFNCPPFLECRMLVARKCERGNGNGTGKSDGNAHTNQKNNKACNSNSSSSRNGNGGFRHDACC